MASITRTKLLLAAAATTLVFAVGAHQSQAATYVGLTALSTDTTLTTSATGVTSKTAFPDGSTTADCFIQVIDSGTHTPAYKSYGNCAGDSITAVLTSYVVDGSAALLAGDQHGAALSIDGTGTWTYAYDAGPKYGANGSFTKTNLQASISTTSGARVVFLLNNDVKASRDGCFNYVDAGGEATPQCFTVTGTGSNGAFYEVQTQAATGTLAEGAAASGTGVDANVPIEGVFFLPAVAGGATATTGTTSGTAVATSTTAPVATSTTVSSVGTPTAVSSVGTPSPTTPVLAASYVRVHRSHGITHLKWYSMDSVHGYNVFDGHTRINQHLVTSHTHWYHFNTRHAFHHLRLVGR